MISLVERAGGLVLAVISDIHASNRSVYSSMRTDDSPSFRTEHPMDSSRQLYMLHDPVHAIKCIRNNWITEKDKRITITLPGGQRVTAKWSDIRATYESEKGNVVKRTTLTSCAINPSSIEKVKVAPVLQVFNDKIVAALAQDKRNETAAFVYHILKMWKIVNNKSTTAHVHLNDPDRMPITSPECQQLQFLSEMSSAVKQMSAVRRGKARHGTFTRETTESLTQSLDGLIALSKYLLLEKGLKFVLLGVFQSDCIEGEFGVYRQAFGGLYYITFEQVLTAAKGRRLQLFQALAIDLDSVDHQKSECCNNLDLSPDDMDIFDSLEQLALENVSHDERNTLFYIAGYVAMKEGIRSTEIPPSSEDCETSDCEFTHLLSRGKLTYPPTELFQFSLLCYTFFAKSPRTCKRQLLNVFEQIHDSYATFPKNTSVLKRLANTYMNGYVKKFSDLHGYYKAADQRKKQKLSAD